MKIYYHAENRKPLVQAVSEFTGEKAEYLFMPTCAYKIGRYTVDKEGNLVCDDTVDRKETERLVEFLAQKGFSTATEPPAATESPEQEELPSQEETGAQVEDLGAVVAVPIEKLQMEKLEKILEAKGGLICKALEIPSAKVTTGEGRVFFPWLRGGIEDSKREACLKLIEALCRMSREQKRINAKVRNVENEKYAFRCFLLRLGFIGKEYKADRKALLKNFTGSSAFKTEKRKEEECHAVSE